MKTAQPAVGFDLRPLFAPRSIAVVGASLRSGIATTVRDNIAMVGGSAQCWFVNPRYDEVDGTRCYPDLAALPEIPETVVLAVNPLRAAQFTREAVDAGVPVVVIPGGGVVEGGAAAAQMQAEVRAIAIEHGTTVLGPNCMGVVDLTTSSATYIGDLNASIRRGGVAGIAQSGSVTDAFIHAAGSRIGWSRIVSCGAEAVLDVCDYLAYCIDDPATTAIVLFLEGFRRPERFLALADRALSIGKPILAVKVGRSEQAQAAAIAHSGSLAGEDRVMDAAFRAAGVVRFDDLDELLEAAELLAGAQRLGRSVGRGRTGVITVSTGEGSLVADLAPRLGLHLPPLPPAAEARIAEALPSLGYVGNPMDPWGAADTDDAYRPCLEAFASSGAYDVVAIVHDFPFRSQAGEVELATELAEILATTTSATGSVLPLFVSLTSGDATPEVQAVLDRAGGIPLVRGLVEAFGAIPRLAWWEARRAARELEGPWRDTWPALARAHLPLGGDLDAVHAAPSATPMSGTPMSGAGTIARSERESLELLAAAGLPTVRSILAATPEEAVRAAQEIGGRVVVKVDAPGLAHKSDVGGVVVDVQTPDEVRSAADEVVAAARRAGREPNGVLVQPFIAGGVELIIGARRDGLLGPVVLAGLGGILAEVLDDVAVRPTPVSADRAAGMLDELRGAVLLGGVRGRPPLDRSAICSLVAALAGAIEAHAEWVAVDCNPVIAKSAGVTVVDALVVERARPDA